MTWLFVATSAFFLLAIVSLVDKYVMKGLIPSSKVYAFYVGVLGLFALALIPFGFFIPNTLQITLALLAGAFHVIGLIAYFEALKRFETSRVVPAIGGIAPLCTFGLGYLFLGGESFGLVGILAFSLLILGSVLISWERNKKISFASLKLSALAAFLFAAYFVTAKLVYMEQPFISGFVWTRIGAFLVAVVLFFSKEVREELFTKRKTFKMKTWAIVLPNQGMGAAAVILQNWAIALAGAAYIAVISALSGVQYVFVLLFAAFLSLKFPKILKEEISREVLLQKIVSILLIGGGLALLAL